MHKKTITVDGVSVRATFVNTVIVGSGAAGMAAAVKLIEFWSAKGVQKPHERLLVVTAGRTLGASRMSGSDKQTYYKMGTSPRVPDTAEDFAGALTAFGACHGDTALAEGIASLRGFYHLVEVGVPFPHDPWGAFIGYKTDHDPYERATSAGPKTSRFMSEKLEAKARRQGVEIADGYVVAEFITEGGKDSNRVVGLVCLDKSRASGEDAPLSAFFAENWILAAGGPGEIYKTTVYPHGQAGIHGSALRAGLVACNLTESQYGLASTKFRWNVSGTYMQVVPRIFSTDAEGADEREFLTEYFDDMPTMATAIFLKGYQWPFDAQRIVDHQSSLVDVAVHQETVVRGRRVWMDFLANPVGRPGWDGFDIRALGEEALEYLEKAGATQRLPIERLEHMNPPAIEIYGENGIDLHHEPLEIALCAQHHNGGFAVNKWWESNIPHVFVVGEMAGTHGVKRPGGSALNAGQVGAMRAAEYIANVYTAAAGLAVPGEPTAALKNSVRNVLKILEKGRTAATTPDAALEEIQERMTLHGAHMRSRAGAVKALAAALDQLERLNEQGLRISAGADLSKAVSTMGQCLTHVAMLTAICAMFERGTGSRGSHCILDEGGIEMHPRLVDPQTGAPYRFLEENKALREVVVSLAFNEKKTGLFDVWDVPVRPIPVRDIAFEPAWTEFRQGRIYEI